MRIAAAVNTPVIEEAVCASWSIFFNLCQSGTFTFGGAYAMLSPIEDTCVKKKKWITHDEMMDITVITESTPGPIASNCATYLSFMEEGLH